MAAFWWIFSKNEVVSMRKTAKMPILQICQTMYLAHSPKERVVLSKGFFWAGEIIDLYISKKGIHTYRKNQLSNSIRNQISFQPQVRSIIRTYEKNENRTQIIHLQLINIISGYSTGPQLLRLFFFVYKSGSFNNDSDPCYNQVCYIRLFSYQG